MYIGSIPNILEQIQIGPTEKQKNAVIKNDTPKMK